MTDFIEITTSQGQKHTINKKYVVKVEPNLKVGGTDVYNDVTCNPTIYPYYHLDEEYAIVKNRFLS